MSTPIVAREVQIDSESRKKPRVVHRLAEWEYLERSVHRMLCGWGRHFSEWTDKVELSRQVWEQAECVRRIRERLIQFPGTTSNLDAPVSRRLEAVVNAVLLAPSFEDWIDGCYRALNGALAQSYLHYAQAAHPVHDAPTVAALNENMRVKEQLRLWLRAYRRRNPHRADAAYMADVQSALEAAANLREALPVEAEPARPVGVGTGFRPPARAAHPAGSRPEIDIMPVLEGRFQSEVEVRRLFWCYGYLLEMNLAEDQLVWLWDAHEMPWEFLQDVSRHMWDESRHGDSGHSRLLDFGIALPEIGYPYYDPALPNSLPVEQAEGQAEAMDAKALYDAVFFIGMVAETGHFAVKHEAYDDFKDGGDLESAEMMLFDIIDETSHVQYAHRWLPLLAERAGLGEIDIRKAGQAKRQELLKEAVARAAESAGIPEDDPRAQRVNALLARMREQVPLSNASSCPPRSYKPM